MRDVVLFGKLREGARDAEAIVPLLVELSAQPLARRVPLFAALRPALGHAQPAVRAAALGALVGADGALALEAFVSALDDDDERVRHAGLTGLALIYPQDPWRWAHAAFHPRPEVRLACLRAPGDARNSPLHLYLLGDAGCRRELMQRLGNETKDATLALPDDAYPVILAFRERGYIGADHALRLLAELEVAQILLHAARGTVRPEPLQVALVEAASEEAVEAAVAAYDGFDGLFEILVAARDPRRVRLAADLASALIDGDPLVRRRACAAARAAMVRAGEDEEVALLVACCDPLILLLDVLQHETRCAVLARIPRVPRELPAIEPTLAVKLARTLGLEHGVPSLPVLAGIARLARKLSPVLVAVGREALVEAVAADPRAAAELLLVPDGSKFGRSWLLKQLAAKDAHGRVLAWLALRAPSDQLEFVTKLEPWQAFDLALSLAELELEGDLKQKKVDRLVPMIAARLAAEPPPRREYLHEYALAFLAMPDAGRRRFGRAMFEELANGAGAEDFARAMMGLDATLLAAFITILPGLTRLGCGCEAALAYVLADHEVAEVRDWALSHVPPAPPPAPPPPAIGVYRLEDDEVEALVSCPNAAFPSLVCRYLRVPTRRLAEALARRPDPIAPCRDACLALLGCHDEPALVAAQLERFVSDPLLPAIDEAAVIAWERCASLPWVGAAWLWRWERHAFAVATQMLDAPEGPAAWLRGALAIPSQVLRASVAQAIGCAFGCWVAREAAAFGARFDDEAARALVAVVLDLLDSDLDEGAARIFVSLLRARVDAARDAQDAVRALLPDMSDAARSVLEPVMRARGLLGRAAPRRVAPVPVRVDILAAIRASTDPDELARWCAGVIERAVHEALLRALELGEPALDKVADVALAAAPAPHLRTLLESIALWHHGPALERLRAAIDSAAAPELRFRLALVFVERGLPGLLERACAIACEPDGQSWMRPADYERLERLLGAREAAIRLCSSPQPHAYLRAVELLLADPEPDERSHAALRGFLEVDSQRFDELRVRAAAYLQRRGDLAGFPILFEHALDPKGSYGALFKGAPGDLVDGVVDAVLLGGAAVVSEARALMLLEPAHVEPAARDRAYERLGARKERRAARRSAVQRVAQVFAWGVREAMLLTRRRQRIHMASRDKLGYTRIEGDSIWVSALPILRGDRRGQEIVEALILHELGHHRHHRGERAREVWEEAQREGIHGLLNLVADEHLERNLRALDESYGDRLKVLGAHAFQHARRDIPVASLLAALGADACAVLGQAPLGLSRVTGSVRVESGALLTKMERHGLSFARFARALRMGLGDRHGDPRVAAALALFDKRFRHLDMDGLLALARRLRDLFGWETSLCESYGGHEAESDDAREGSRHGISDEEVQREVERVLNPKKREAASDVLGGPGKLWINVAEDEQFDLIHNVESVTPDAERHRALTRDVLRPARSLRAYLERLGLNREVERRRLSGTRVDRPRVQGLVTRGDPRVLMRRELTIQSDLFIGLLVDCSGSMQTNDNIDKARRFACLVAEAARGLRGVDARFFGFSDTVIFDAGDARRCAAASLELGGGNNDAAALFHAARVAKQSRRRAKVLCMISDGLPTECSAAALKGLVARLSRSGMSLAQVAVAPIEEHCFPDYVLLSGDTDGAVRRFGQVVAKLVRRALG
jgi:hypothetical protein